MSDEEKYAVIGKTVSEHAEVRKQITLLRTRLREIGETYRFIGRQLNELPDHTIAFGELVDARFATQRVNVALSTWVDIAGVLDLARQLRDAAMRETELATQLTQLGVPPR